MKSLPYWLRLTTICTGFAGTQFGFNLWKNESLERAIGEAFLQTFVFGVLMNLSWKYGWFKKNQK